MAFSPFFFRFDVPHGKSKMPTANRNAGFSKCSDIDDNSSNRKDMSRRLNFIMGAMPENQYFGF
jgi:hypothetical protein